MRDSEEKLAIFLHSDGFAKIKTCLRKLRINAKLESWMLKRHGVSCSQVLVSHASYKISSREFLKHALGYSVF